MTATAAPKARPSPVIARFLPILGWLPTYNRAWLGADLLAAVTVAAFACRRASPTPSLAGLPPQAGLYAGMVAPIAYALFGTSRQLGIGATSASPCRMPGVDDPGVRRAGGAWRCSSARSASSPGSSARVPGQLHLRVGADRLLGRGGALHRLNPARQALRHRGGQRRVLRAHRLHRPTPRRDERDDPGARLRRHRRPAGRRADCAADALVAGCSDRGILLLSVTALETEGSKSSATSRAGCRRRLPASAPSDLGALFPAALAVFLLAYVEGMGGIQTFAKKHKYRADANQELLALGVANAASGSSRPSRSVGASRARRSMTVPGRRPPLSGLGTGVLVGAVALFLTGLFTNLPEAILGAVVIVAVRGLFNVPALRRLYDASRREFLIAMVAFGGVLVFGMLQGVLIGAAVSLLMLVWRVSRPHTTLLGRVPGSASFSDLDRHPENEVLPDILVYRVDGETLLRQLPRCATTSKPDRHPGVAAVAGCLRPLRFPNARSGGGRHARRVAGLARRARDRLAAGGRGRSCARPAPPGRAGRPLRHARPRADHRQCGRAMARRAASTGRDIRADRSSVLNRAN